MSNNPDWIYCLYCKSSIARGHDGPGNFRRHRRTKKHRAAVKAQKAAVGSEGEQG